MNTARAHSIPGYQEENAVENGADLIRLSEHHAAIFGTNGRWCEVCQAYKHFAVLHRHGNTASEVFYTPHCPTDDSLLLPVPPQDEF